jgi:RNA polymerase sigma-70 factor (ECF subfamily)
MLRMGGEDYTVSEPDTQAIHLWNEIRRLPRRQSQVMALRYYDQLPIADIALVLECSETTVKTHIQRAKKALVVRLEGENPK